MARFLLQTHAPTTGLAHLGTAISIGGELARRGHEVGIAYGGERPELIEAAGLRRHPVAEVRPEREWQPKEWFTGADELAVAVDSHLELIRALAPEAIIACHGVHGRVAAEIAGTPLLHVNHYLHTSLFGRAASVKRDRLRDLGHPRRAWRVGRARVRALRARSRPRPLRTAVAELRRRHGLPDAPPEAVAGCPDSVVALSTAPFIVPANDLPEHWRYVGPVSWSPAAPGPKPPPGDAPLAYVSQGSTGTAELLERSTRELAEGGFGVIATTGGLLAPERLERLGDRVVAEPILDGPACMRAAEVAVIHGGHQTLLDAIATGTPIVALPTKSDQIGQVHRIERLGIGSGLYPQPLLPGAIRRAARRALRPTVAARSEALRARLRHGWDGVENSADLAEALAGGEIPGEALGR